MCSYTDGRKASVGMGNIALLPLLASALSNSKMVESRENERERESEREKMREKKCAIDRKINRERERFG